MASQSNTWSYRSICRWPIIVMSMCTFTFHYLIDCHSSFVVIIIADKSIYVFMTKSAINALHNSKVEDGPKGWSVSTCFGPGSTGRIDAVSFPRHPARSQRFPGRSERWNCHMARPKSIRSRWKTEIFLPKAWPSEWNRLSEPRNVASPPASLL